jgi:all-trans-retinol 13,14-reductase
MSKKQVVIIGSGLGGLACGVILAKNGYNVTVLEQGTQVGGCLQCFQRRGAKFETGMHFIGSAAEGQTLDRLMQYLEMKQDVSLSPLDPTGYEVIALGGEEYRFANGRRAFIDQMATRFPQQRENLERYFELVERVAAASSLHSMKHAETDAAINTQYLLRSVNEVIDEVITDPLLANVLVGDLPLYAAERDKTPFATHAFITDFYNQSAYRVVGGSDHIATSLSATIQRYGGQVLTRQKATKIVCNDTQAVGVETDRGEYFAADYIISDAHPVRTLELVDSRMIRPAYRSRINATAQTPGGFSVYLEFKEDTLPYMNYNLYGYHTESPWGCERYDEASWPKGLLYMHFCQEPSPRYAKTGVVISYMQMKDVERWKNTRTGHRGNDYEDFKQAKAERLLHVLEQLRPGTMAAIKHYYTSTPLTYRDYTGTEDGGMYGIARDIRLGAANRVSHRTRIPNLYLTGQNINSHGMLGVMVGCIVTCSEFLTAERIYQQILEANRI